ncbi:Tryptophanyl-tRNA synthetase, class Ib [gamma proteobacterium HdN1]|nr:Tryptophanyl-tRNA synthetase, class Ib [gamma proteobacterium HdN1]
MTKQRYLTGITTTGTPHLGNYVGAIRPAIEASRNPEIESFYFLADYHALIKCFEPEKIRQSSREIAATWLALGLDTDHSTFYRQSDIPEIMELTWMLTCVTAKGLMNRAHAYKASVQENEQSSENDPDKGITMGLFSYPILMSADILMFNAHKIPVGRDQIQHIEMARDIGQRFNYLFGEQFVLPEAAVDDQVAVLAGLDGRKMSKSYGNTIPLFSSEKELKKLINRIKTNLKEPGEPKETSESALFEIWQAFATPDQIQYMRDAHANGIAWGQAKKELFELINEQLTEPRNRYQELMNDLGYIDEVLKKGAEKARAEAIPRLEKARASIGIARTISQS